MLQWKASECRLYSWCPSQSCDKGHQEMPDKASMKKVWEFYLPKPALQLNHPISSFEPSIVTSKAPTARWSIEVAGAVPGPPFSRTTHASTLLSMVGQTFPMPVCKHLSVSHKAGRIGSLNMRLPVPLFSLPLGWLNTRGIKWLNPQKIHQNFLLSNILCKAKTIDRAMKLIQRNPRKT